MPDFLVTCTFTITTREEDLPTAQRHGRILPNAAFLLGAAMTGIIECPTEDAHRKRNGGEVGRQEEGWRDAL